MSKIEVDEIVKQSGSTLTLGGPGTAVTLGSGATQTGFGRTGTVDWCTTAKTSPFTAVSGDGFFVNTTSGGITVTLPSSPSAGDIVAFKDYANTWDCNAVTVCRNGSKINGQCANATLNTESQSVTLIYVDATKGWQDIHDSTANITGASFVAATGGTITTSGDFKIHTFTSSGCFQVTAAGNEAGSNKISYLVVAGGGGGAGNAGNFDGSAGAGAGGFREGKASNDPYSASPLVAPDGLTASVATFPITVGAGGSGGSSGDPGHGGNGNPSIFSTITSTGGGGGNFPTGVSPTAGAGGSGSGAAATGNPGGTAGAGNTPPVSPPQGNPGGNFTSDGQSAAGGGGGAGAAGGNAPSKTVAGTGGAGATSSINASPVQRAGGGGGSAYPGNTGGNGGAGGGGNGGKSPNNSPPAGQAGTANTGGGGGATNATPGVAAAGGAGGSGVVILRYKFQ